MRVTVAACALVIAAFVTGCEKGATSLSTGPMSGSSELRIYLTDSPAGYDAVNIVIKQVEVHSDNGGWMVVNDSTRTFDLLTLTNGASVLLGDAMLAAGHYTQIRLLLGDGSNVVVDGVPHPLIIPSGFQTGLKLVHEFTLQAPYTYEVMLDFDANKSVHRLGNGRYQMNPVIRIHPVATSGAITGTVDPANAGATVTATSAADTAGTDADTLSGNFKIIALPPAEYQVYFAAWDTTLYRDTALVNVAVQAGQTTNVGIVPLPHK
jgi:hypothetical protein